MAGSIALESRVLKTLPSINASLANRTLAYPVLVPSRNHSHSTLSSKPKIPPRPKQPRETYDIVYQNEPGGLKGWADWAMKKDHRKRGIVVDWGCERQLVLTLTKNRILPREIQEIAQKDLDGLPRYSNHHWAINRCAISSRGRGVVEPWRLSRHFFRQFVDYNKMSGIRRAIW